jgi:putative endonuclease
MWIFLKFVSITGKNTIMKKHLTTGFRGEAAAINWLARQGYMILHTNWRCSRYELDIVAEKSGMLHFIEVKTRTGLQFGYPEAGVTPAKLRKMKSAGAAYLNRNGERIRVQYDIVSILWIEGRAPEILLFEDIG